MSSYINAYTKLLADLLNVNVEIEDGDKALILLGLLPDREYATFMLTSINGSALLSYDEVTTVLSNYELRRKDKQSSRNASSKALLTRGRNLNQSGKDNRSWSKNRSRKPIISMDQYRRCKKHGHWKVDCLENKSKNKGKMAELSEANIVTEGNDSDTLCFSLLITLSVCYADST